MSPASGEPPKTHSGGGPTGRRRRVSQTGCGFLRYLLGEGHLSSEHC